MNIDFVTRIMKNDKIVIDIVDRNSPIPVFKFAILPMNESAVHRGWGRRFVAHDRIKRCRARTQQVYPMHLWRGALIPRKYGTGRAEEDGARG